MKARRQAEILTIIRDNDIETQDQLLEKLREKGMKSTQATISRDIKELQLVKTLSPSGKYKYAQSNGGGPITDRFVKIFKETIKSVTPADNIIVVKTLSGCAHVGLTMAFMAVCPLSIYVQSLPT